MSTAIREKAFDFALRYYDRHGIEHATVADVATTAMLFAHLVETGDSPFAGEIEVEGLMSHTASFGHDDSPEEDVDEALRRSSELIRGERRVDYNDVLGPRTVVQNGNATALDQPGFDLTKVKFDGAHDATSRLGFGKP